MSLHPPPNQRPTHLPSQQPDKVFFFSPPTQQRIFPCGGIHCTGNVCRAKPLGDLAADPGCPSSSVRDSGATPLPKEASEKASRWQEPSLPACQPRRPLQPHVSRLGQLGQPQAPNTTQQSDAGRHARRSAVGMPERLVAPPSQLVGTLPARLLRVNHVCVLYTTQYSQFTVPATPHPR